MTNKKQSKITAESIKMRTTVSLNDEGVITGTLECASFENPVEFTGFIRMIELMELTFDAKGYPENQLLPRAFGRSKRRLARDNINLAAQLKEITKEQTQLKPGTKKSTFEILVRYRRKAEWQGHIHWIEKNNTKQFLSIVELSRLINNALSR